MKTQRLMTFGAIAIVLAFAAFQFTRIGIPTISHKVSFTGKSGKTGYLVLTAPAYTYPGNCSPEFQVKRDLSSELSVNTAAVMEVFSPKGGLVYSDKSCTQTVSELKLKPGQEEAKFYYKSTNEETPGSAIRVRVKPGS